MSKYGNFISEVGEISRFFELQRKDSLELLLLNKSNLCFPFQEEERGKDAAEAFKSADLLKEKEKGRLWNIVTPTKFKE